MSKILTKDWRNEATRKEPMTAPIPSLGASVIIKPMLSQRLFEIEQRFPTDDETGRILDYPGYMRAVIADSVVCEDGSRLWTEKEIAEDLDTEAFWQVWEEVGGFLGLKKRAGEPAKN